MHRHPKRRKRPSKATAAATPLPWLLLFQTCSSDGCIFFNAYSLVFLFLHLTISCRCPEFRTFLVLQRGCWASGRLSCFAQSQLRRLCPALRAAGFHPDAGPACSIRKRMRRVVAPLPALLASRRYPKNLAGL